MKLDRIEQQRVRNTLIVLVIALILGSFLWWHYMYSPWTRDGRVRAEVVNIAAQIAGQVVDLKVVDNQQVHKGDVLFLVDPENYRLALADAEATVQSRLEDMNLRDSEVGRRMKLGAGVISTEDVQIAQNQAAVAKAAYQEAVATRDVAKLNMDRTTIYSPVNGYVTNLVLRIGDYATPGQVKLTIIDSDSFWVAGYFDETKLSRIHPGDYTKIKLMGYNPIVEGHVESISRGIADANAETTSLGLESVDPIFTWVRLAQRIPVRVHIDNVPEGINIAAGMTCTVVVEPGHKK
jgi:RND family efflux transporter MFP subunit